MGHNKHIERESKAATKMYDNRSLATDYRTLKPIIKEGMSILDIGCGTGAISKDMATLVGSSGKVTAIDNTQKFIESGQESYKEYKNLQLIHSDLFDFATEEKFDLITAARVLQWLSNPKEALLKMKSLLKPDGIISILDYDHNNLEWNPAPPESMKSFYSTFLKWRADAGMNNGIANDLPALMEEAGLTNIQSINSNELYTKDRSDFESKVGIWSKVAGLKQLVDEGYIKEEKRLQVIEAYDHWVKTDAISMTMKLNEVRGQL